MSGVGPSQSLALHAGDGRYWAPQQTLANRAVNHEAGQRAEDLKRVATTLVLLAYSELARHFDLSRRALRSAVV